MAALVRLSRPSTPFDVDGFEDGDARNKCEHDESEIVAVGITGRIHISDSAFHAQALVRNAAGPYERATERLAHSSKFSGIATSYAERSTRLSISLRSVLKSIGLVRSASAPLSSARRLVSASP